MDKLATITDAIKNKRMLHLDYHGKSRTVIPHILGYDSKKHLSLSAYQVSGTGNGWRMFHLDEVSNIGVSDMGFSRPRQYYNPKDPIFDKIIAKL